jgi:8-oxo-dGTP pyrophosphatase MutT (NUDIX family)
MNVDLQNIIDRLRIELNKPLPGKAAHNKLVPPDRLLEPPSELIKINKAGVLLLLFPDGDRLKTIFIRRPSSMKHHASQIAFPGGQFEPTDRNLMATALREAVEEVGINSDHVEIIGKLSPLYVRVSNFSIQAFIGWSQAIPLFKIDNTEVADLHIFSINDIANPGSLQNQKVVTTFGITEFPGFLVDDVFIWGATAMILSEFIEVYRQI